MKTLVREGEGDEQACLSAICHDAQKVFIHLLLLGRGVSSSFGLLTSKQLHPDSTGPYLAHNDVTDPINQRRVRYYFVVVEVSEMLETDLSRVVELRIWISNMV